MLQQDTMDHWLRTETNNNSTGRRLTRQWKVKFTSKVSEILVTAHITSKFSPPIPGNNNESRDIIRYLVTWWWPPNTWSVRMKALWSRSEGQTRLNLWLTRNSAAISTSWPHILRSWTNAWSSWIHASSRNTRALTKWTQVVTSNNTKRYTTNHRHRFSKMKQQLRTRTMEANTILTMLYLPKVCTPEAQTQNE